MSRNPKKTTTSSKKKSVNAKKLVSEKESGKKINGISRSKSKNEYEGSPQDQAKAEPSAHLDMNYSAFDTPAGLSVDETFEEDSTLSKKASTISLSLLTKRCINNYRGLKAPQIMELLNDITHVRLDRENLQKIDGLELLGNGVKNLYLQHNEIEVLQGLETLTELRFLTLSNNKIVKVENLRNSKLGFLDLSHNKIEELDVDELPKSLVILSLDGNPCQQQSGYRESILGRCPHLSQLDGDILSIEERRSAGHEVISESEESDEEEEERIPYDYNKPFDAEVMGVFDDLSSDIFLRCQSRVQHVFTEHKARLMRLDRIKAEGGISIEDGDSTPASRVSSRFDSPDSSRPATGNDPAEDSREERTELDEDFGFRLERMKLNRIAENIGRLSNDMMGNVDIDRSYINELSDLSGGESFIDNAPNNGQNVGLEKPEDSTQLQRGYIAERPTASRGSPRSARPKPKKAYT